MGDAARGHCPNQRNYRSPQADSLYKTRLRKSCMFFPVVSLISLFLYRRKAGNLPDN